MAIIDTLKKILSSYNGQTPSTGKEVEDAFNENFETVKESVNSAYDDLAQIGRDSVQKTFKSGFIINDIKNIKTGYYLNQNGVETANPAFKYDPTFYPVLFGMKLRFSGGDLGASYPILCYDSDGNILKSVYGSSPIIFTVFEGVKSIRFNLGTSSSYSCTIEEDFILYDPINSGLISQKDLYMNDRGLDEYLSTSTRWSGSATNKVLATAVKTYPMTKSGLINTIFLPFYSESRADWTIRLIKNSLTPSNVIFEETIDANIKNISGFFHKLNRDVFVNEGDIVYAYVTSRYPITTVYNATRTPLTGRDRLPLYYQWTYDSLTLVEGNTSMNGYEPYLGYIQNKVLLETLNDYINTRLPDICLPPYLYAVANKELMIYDDNWLNVDDRDSRFTIKISDSGNVTQRYARGIKFSNPYVGNSTVYLDISDTAKKINIRKSIPVITSATAKGNGSIINLMTVGDSIINSDNVTAELYALLSASGITVNQIGTRGPVGNRHEGRGSWSFDSYLTKQSYEGAVNAFWDTSINGINFQKYFNDNKAAYFPNATTIDYAIIYLGTNDVSQAYDSIPDYASIIGNARRFIDILRSSNRGFPLCKIIFALPSFGATTPALSSGFNNVVYQTGAYWGARFKEKMVTLNNLYLNELSSYSNLIYAPLFPSLDRKFGHGRVELQASSRITSTESYSRDFIHPDKGGSQQLADVFYCSLKSLL